MTRPRTTSGVLPTPRTLDQQLSSDVLMTRHTFEAHARHRTAVTDAILTMRVVTGRMQVIGAAGHEAWTIGAGELVVVSGPGAIEMQALLPSELWLGVHHAVHQAAHRERRLALG